MAPERVEMADHVTHPLGQTDADDHGADDLTVRAAQKRREEFEWLRLGGDDALSAISIPRASLTHSTAHWRCAF